jgi:HAD superfamily hydrolase (TIGR01509 family)
MMYKATFFDLDGVLTTNRTGAEQTCKYLAEQFGIDSEMVRTIGAKYGKELGLGKINYDSFLSELSVSIGKDVTMSDLENAFKSAPKNNAMFDLISEVKDKGLLVGVITDNDQYRFDVLKNELGLDEVFDSLTTSAEAGSFKSDKKIFESALGVIGVDAENAIFIDNKKQNLYEARALGMYTIYFDDALNDIAVLRKELMEIL